MKRNALVLYVDGNFSIIEDTDGYRRDIQFLEKYLLLPGEDRETKMFDIERFGDKDEYVIFRNTKTFGEYKIKNEQASNLVGRDVYWNCAIMKLIDSDAVFVELGLLEEEDIVKILSLSEKSAE